MGFFPIAFSEQWSCNGQQLLNSVNCHNFICLWGSFYLLTKLEYGNQGRDSSVLWVRFVGKGCRTEGMCSDILNTDGVAATFSVLVTHI